ncbi:MAG: AAA family ATPase [Oscillospiraceae bacterium]|nr:AAA family ATPase [Oscillospiraceae bacterium]
MKILSMTATFGKLEHQTLTLKPGLNIIQAPNEWGKSTWCAFLVSMLYGIDTGTRTTKSSLADKERYAPWSGSPMSGRMEIQWNGKNITIERHTKGRLIFGDFRAYETDSGLDIPELTASNCGQMLLGVERSVFLRAGFLRLTDLPVTQDDALRRRLNNLVTTGDESGTGDKLAQKLKDLKNKCRFNRTGLLPQAEAEQELLQRKLNQLQDLNSQQENCLARQEQLADMIRQLENHKAALEYEAAREDTQRVEQAIQSKKEAETAYQAQLALCQGLPSPEETTQALQLGKALQQQVQQLQTEQQSLPTAPQPPQAPEVFQSHTPEEAIAKAQADFAAVQNSKNRKKSARLWKVCGSLFCVLSGGSAAAAALLSLPVPLLLVALGLLLAGIGLASWSFIREKRIDSDLNRLLSQYGNLDPNTWLSLAASFASSQAAYDQAEATYRARMTRLTEKEAELASQIEAYTKGKPLQEVLDFWQQAGNAQEALDATRRNLSLAENHAKTLQAMVKTVPQPEEPDTLNAPWDDTVSLLSRVTEELQQNRQRLGQLQGQAEGLGQEADIRKALKAVTHRIEKLEDTYQALELALRALSSASNELQRRFAPRISKRAQELFCKLTEGRYPRISLGEDLSLSAAAEQEDVLHSIQWCSEGTADQLYLALRLAVAEELTSEAPLILDDALVRFDDTRLSQALQILKEEAETKQVLLFTCQSREKSLV